MYATILQQMTPMGVMQVAVVPLQDGTVRQFYRNGKNRRGVAGAWYELQPSELLNIWPFDLSTGSGTLAGEPHAIPISASDYKMLQYPVTPTTLVQKLCRTAVDENDASTTEFASVYREVLQYASENPVLLAKYHGTRPQVVAPVIQIVPQAQPDVVQEPAPVMEAPVYAGVETHYVELPPVPQSFVPAQVESESPMTFSTTVLPNTVDSHAVLTVPDPEPYFSRKFFGNTEAEIYDAARANQWNVLLTGDAGTGKTSSARNYASKNALPFVTIECTQQIDQSITQGRFVPTGEGNATKWKYSQLATAIQQPSVILINELTRMTPKAASLFLRLLQERELLIEPLNEVIKVHPGVLFIADQNTGLGYTGTSKQDAALVDRFNVKLEFHYDTTIESKFIDSATLLSFASNIREASELNDEFSVPMSTRILKNFVAQAKNLGFEFAINSMLSNYPKLEGERDAIKMRFDAEAPQIASELGVELGKYSTN